MGMMSVEAATIMTSREFSQDAGRAKKRALKGPVFITDRGKPAHVLLSIEDYRRLQNGRQTVAQMFEQSEQDALDDFEFEEFKDRVLARPAEFDPE